MTDSRPSVPAGIKRRLFEEAGYRCAVPTCRGTSALDMEHIEPWSNVQEHKFENMVVLCAVCHRRVTSGEIHKNAIRAYKRNLAILSGRYSLYEFRLIELFYQDGISKDRLVKIPMSKHDLLHVKGLLDDGLIAIEDTGAGMVMGDLSMTAIYAHLTQQGLHFVTNYFSGELVEK